MCRRKPCACWSRGSRKPGKYDVWNKSPFQRNEPLMAGRRRFGLLLAAHGERRMDADNAGVARLARSLADKGVAVEIGFGFIKGSPPVDEAIGALSSRDVVVYPLFLSDGYFTRVV